MIGKIIDMNKTDAFINFQNGTTMDISVTKLPSDAKIGDAIDIDISTNNLHSSTTSNKVIDFFM